MTYESAVATFLRTDASFAGGLSNHGPMASEALVSMGADRWIEPFVEAYRDRLRPYDAARPIAPREWRAWLRTNLPSLVPAVSSQAGHGLLRVAHAVRALERVEDADADPDVHLAELRAAIDYWASGETRLPVPPQLRGPVSADRWVASLGRLESEQRPEGLLTKTLTIVGERPGYVDDVAALAASPDVRSTLDALAVAAAGFYLRNDGLGAFALLHGVTVSNMSRQLLPHLADHDARRLEAAVAGFVAAAIIGFDVRDEQGDSPSQAPALDAETLAERAGATLDDHTIKLTDAALDLADRTGSRIPLLAAEKQISTTS